MGKVEKIPFGDGMIFVEEAERVGMTGTLSIFDHKTSIIVSKYPQIGFTDVQTHLIQ